MGARRSRIAVVAAVATLVLAACGGGGDDDPATDPTAPSADTTTTTAGATEADTVTVAATVYFAGFEVTLDDAVHDPAEGSVVVGATFVNTGETNAAFNGTSVLTSGGESVQADGLRSDLPEVPGGTTGQGAIGFAVSDTFTFDDAVVTIGREGNNQAIVPLGAEGELVTLEPVALDVDGMATAGQLDLALHGGELRADVPENHRQVEEGSLAVTLDIDLTNNSTGGGGYAFSGDNLALTLPDGTTIAPDKSPIELLGRRATLSDQQVRFIVDDPAPGTYTLLLREGELDGPLEFEIPATATVTG